MAESITISRAAPEGVSILNELIDEVYWHRFPEFDAIAPGFGRLYTENAAKVRRMLFRRYVLGEHRFAATEAPQDEEISRKYRDWRFKQQPPSISAPLQTTENVSYDFAPTIKRRVAEVFPGFKSIKAVGRDGNLVFERALAGEFRSRIAFSPSTSKQNFYLLLGLNRPEFLIFAGLFFGNAGGLFMYESTAEFHQKIDQVLTFISEFLPHFERAILAAINRR